MTYKLRLEDANSQDAVFVFTKAVSGLTKPATLVLEAVGDVATGFNYDDETLEVYLDYTMVNDDGSTDDDVEFMVNHAAELLDVFAGSGRY